MKSVLIVCEAGPGNGLGHFYRSAALAQIISGNFRVSILSNNPDLPKTTVNLLQTDDFEKFEHYNIFDLVILDSYGFNSNLISTLIKSEIPFVEISDFKQQLYPTKHWFNSSVNEQNIPGRGLNYSLLRPEFLEAARNKEFKFQSIDSVFIAFGGTDESSNSLRIVEKLLSEKVFARIGVLYPKTGADFEALKRLSESNSGLQLYFNLSAQELIQTAEKYSICLVSSSTIACEMIALRKLVFTTCLYDNQQLLHIQIIHHNAAFEIDPAKLKANSEYFNSLLKNAENKEVQERLFEQQKKLIDGNAEDRIHTFISNCFL